MASDTSGSTASMTLPVHLQSSCEIHVIISILSGSHTAQSHYDGVLKPYLDSHQIKYVTHVTESTQTIIELTKSQFLPKALNGVKQTILLLSGDGGLIDIVDTVASQLHAADAVGGTPCSTANFVKPVVCLVPQGTANALAWSSRIAHNPLETLVAGHAENLPIFEVTFSSGSRLVANEGADREEINSVKGENPKMYGAVVFSWGIHASLVARSDTTEYRKHGIERFKMAAYELLEENHAYFGNVSIQTADSSDWQPLTVSNADLSVGSSSANSNADDPVDDQSDAASTSPDARAEENANMSASDGEIKDGNKGKLSYLAATLVSNLEEKYLISPYTKPISGSMFLISMPHVPAAAVASLTHLPYEGGQHIQDSRVGYQEISGMKIEFLEDVAQWRQVCIDGKIVEVEKQGWVILRNLVGRKGSSSSNADPVQSGRIIDIVVPAST